MPTSFMRHQLPSGGMATNAPSDQIPEVTSPNLLNVRFKFDEIRPAPGRATLQPAVESTIRTICRFSVDDKTKWIVLITDTALYKWGDTAPGSPAQWFKASGVTFQGSGRWDWTTGEDCLFFARQDGGGIYRWRGGANAVDMVPGAPSNVRFVTYFNNRLLAANVVESGQTWDNRVRYPVNGDHTNWTGNGSGFIDFYEPEQEPITGIKVLLNRAVVFREHSIAELSASGSTAQVFYMEQRTGNVGCPFPYTIDSNGIVIMFMGNDGNVWAWNGASLQSIGDALKKNFEFVVDFVGGHDVYYGKVYPFENEYWLWLGAEYLYILDLGQGRWTLEDKASQITAIGDGELYVTPNNWGAAQGSWGSWGKTMWSSMTSRAVSRLIAGLSDNSTISIGRDVVGRYDGSVIDSFIETKDFYANQSNNPLGVKDPIGPMMMRTIERLTLIYQYNNDVDLFELGISTDRGRTWQTRVLQPSTVGFSLTDWKITGPIARFRVRQSSVLPVFRWQGLVEEYVPGGPYKALEQIPAIRP